MANYQLQYNRNQVNNAIKYQSNYNYLLNPNFKINQREETSYAYSSSIKYSVDRWRLTTSSSSTATQDVNTLEWTFTGTFEQVIENYQDFKGLKVTGTLNWSAFSGTGSLIIYDGVNSSNVSLDSSKTQAILTHTVNANATTLIFRVTATSITLTSAKLEKGENSTPILPRANGEELKLCQRYFLKPFLEGQTGNYKTAYLIQSTLILPNTLRTTPIINVLTYPYAFGGGTKYTITSITFEKMNNNLLVLNVDAEHSTTALFAVYDFYCLKNGEITLDAEIY